MWSRQAAAAGAVRTLVTASQPARRSASRPLAFAFDIDGVLKQGPNVLPCAKRALKMLEGNNSRSERIPYLFITNGGGYAEADRARRLSVELEVDVQVDQVIQAHTVFSTMAKEYGKKPILVIGPLPAREIMSSYGFENIFTANDLHSFAPASWPFSRPPDGSKFPIRVSDSPEPSLSDYRRH